MSSEGAYFLRRQAGAESFRRAWEAALDFGIQRLRDLARPADDPSIPYLPAAEVSDALEHGTAEDDTGTYYREREGEIDWRNLDPGASPPRPISTRCWRR